MERCSSLNRHNGNVASAQLLSDTEADLPEADEQQMTSGGRPSRPEEGQAGTAEPADERRGEHRDEHRCRDGIERREQLEPPGR